VGSKIQLLSEHTINQIAAGEVIENPASLVKELVENALDAGSTKIVVEVMGGGLQKIVISDNGCGMGKEDAVLSLQRHATSKIQDAADLIKVMTMGFRGEALASIAAISKMTLKTAEAEGLGTEIQVEGGKTIYEGPCSRAQGTTIEVRQLFYNVPARKKFQKPPAYCLAEVTKVMTALSLSYPSVAFELYQIEEGPILKLGAFPSESKMLAFKKRALDVLGDEFMEGSFCIEGAFAPFACYGVIGSLQKTRANRALQYQFLNQRSVLCPAVSFAIKDALGTRIEERRFPIYALHLDIPTEFIDVNVHPQKREVRLREEKYFTEELKNLVEKSLFSSSPVSITEPVQHLFAGKNPFFSSLPWEEKPLQERKKVDEEFILESRQAFVAEVEPEVIGLYDYFLWINASSVALEGFSQEGIILVHLQRASSQLLFDSLSDKGKGAESQMLFLPLTWNTSAYETKKIHAGMEEIQKMGFSLQESRGSFLVEAIPPSLGELEAMQFLQDYLLTEEMERGKKLSLATAKIVKQRKISYTQIGALAVFKALLKSTSPYICPTGEKSIAFIDKDDLGKFFR
jgi:DNA mismatch repair protein MutL